MRTTNYLILASIVVGSTLNSAHAEATPLTLEQVIELTLTGPKAQMASSDTAAAQARVAEADAARYPRIKATGFATISPEIRCENAECTQTDPDQFALRFSGGFVGGSIEVVQPLYTFGKISSARTAARAGVAAQRALEDDAAGQLAIDATRAYWGLKLARELGYMLDDGIEEIGKAVERLAERESDGSGEVTVQDRLRIETLLAEAKIQRADAAQGESIALAGLRALTGDDTADIDVKELTAVAFELPTVEQVIEQASVGKADLRAAQFGARAASSLADFERRQNYPDLALVGTASITRAQGTDEPPGAFFYDPFNSTSAGLALVLRWQIEPWNVKAKAARAQAAASKALQLAALAATGAGFEARSAHAESLAAQTRLQAAKVGEQAGRAWVASVLQADAIGASEPKDLADAYLAWFQMRARLMTATFQWNVSVVRMKRATGELTAAAQRPW